MARVGTGWLSVVLALGVGCGGTERAGDSGDGGASNEAGESAGATAGSETNGGSGGGAVCPTETGPIEPTALIDDFEDGNGNLATTASRNGSWWVAADMTAGGEITPPTGLPTAIPAEPILGTRCGSAYGMRVTGQGFDDWGAILGLAFRYDADGIVAEDLSAYRGVRFWARRGETHTATVRVDFGDVYSDSAGGFCDPAGGPMGCGNTFGTGLQPLTTEWQEYVIYFDTLRQSGSGLRRDALETTQVWTLGFYMPPGTVFDLWLDDLWLVR